MTGVKIGIVGPVSKDRMISSEGNMESMWGAVAYTALALARLLEGTKDQVVCLAHLSPEDAGDARAFLDHPNIIVPEFDSAYTTGTKIELKNIDNQERISRQTRLMTPVSAAELGILADCDYLVLMPLNDTDISFAAVQQFRKTSGALIFLDLHGLITGVDPAGRRYKKRWENPDKWLNTVDILKMNDKEAQWAAGSRLETQADYSRYAGTVVGMGAAVCWITFGDQSSLIAWRRDERVLLASVPVVDVGKVVNTVGCGDSATAGFIYSYAKLQKPVMAVVLGNILGSARASFSSIKEFPSRPEVRGMVYRHYRDYLHTLLDEFLTQQHVIVREIREDQNNEGSLHGTDGYWNDNGANDESGCDSKGTTAPWS